MKAPPKQFRSEQQQQRLALARRAEELAANHLRAAGFQIVRQNLRIGRDELDLVARRDGLLVICEVRSRSHTAWIQPAATITPQKRMRIRRAAAALVRAWALDDCELRLDVASVTFRGAQAQLNYLEGAL